MNKGSNAPRKISTTTNCADAPGAGQEKIRQVFPLHRAETAVLMCECPDHACECLNRAYECANRTCEYANSACECAAGACEWGSRDYECPNVEYECANSASGCLHRATLAAIQERSPFKAGAIESGGHPEAGFVALRRLETPVGRGSCRAVINPWREQFIVKGTMAARPASGVRRWREVPTSKSPRASRRIKRPVSLHGMRPQMFWTEDIGKPNLPLHESG